MEEIALQTGIFECRLDGEVRIVEAYPLGRGANVAGNASGVVRCEFASGVALGKTIQDSAVCVGGLRRVAFLNDDLVTPIGQFKRQSGPEISAADNANPLRPWWMAIRLEGTRTRGESTRAMQFKQSCRRA